MAAGKMSWSFLRGGVVLKSVSLLSSNGDEKAVPLSAVSEHSGALQGA